MKISLLSKDRNGQHDNVKIVEEFLIAQIKNYDRGSEFEKIATYLIQNVAESQWINLLLAQCYDVIYLLDSAKQRIAAFMAYQKHGDEWHIFRFQVEEPYQNQGYTIVMAEALRPLAPEYGVKKIRVGKPSTNIGERKANDKAVALLLRLQKKGWYVDMQSHMLILQ